jgi:orotate phosphoribosyltransferase
MADLSRRLASDLLSIQAVRLSPDDPFTWTSGLRSPIYCDNRLTIGYPDIRRRIAEGFADVIRSEGVSPDIVAGTATAGIPHAAWLADVMSLPLVYVRSQAKGHGAGRQIEGPHRSGQKVVLVEDLVSTGGSSVAAVDALRSAGLDVTLVVAIFSYELPAAEEAFASAGVPFRSLTSIEALLDVSREDGSLDGAAITSILDWKSNPHAWSEARSS